MPISHDLIGNAHAIPTWVLTTRDKTDKRCISMASFGVQVIRVAPAVNGGIQLLDAVRALAKRGLNSVLVEGGGNLAASLLKANLVDRLVLFRAPTMIGADGIAAVANLGIDRLDLTPSFTRISLHEVGTDIVERYARVNQEME